MILLVVGTVLSIAFAIIGGVGRRDVRTRRCIAHADGRGRSRPPVEDVGYTVSRCASRHRERLSRIGSMADDRHGPGVPGDRAPVRRPRRAPRGHRAVRSPPARRCSGFAVREAPHGPATDCMKGWDAYSHGHRFWVCWERFTGAPEVERWMHSANPWSVPVDEGGAIHEHR